MTSRARSSVYSFSSSVCEKGAGVVTDRIRGERAAEMGPLKGMRPDGGVCEERADDALAWRECEMAGWDVGPKGSESSVTVLRGADRSGSLSTSSFRLWMLLGGGLRSKELNIMLELMLPPRLRSVVTIPKFNFNASASDVTLFVPPAFFDTHTASFHPGTLCLIHLAINGSA
jgi:hypothetical protein